MVILIISLALGTMNIFSYTYGHLHILFGEKSIQVICLF
jgi:hypothetical protein